MPKFQANISFLNPCKAMYNLSWGQDEEKIGYTREWVSDEGKDEQVRRGASVLKKTQIFYGILLRACAAAPCLYALRNNIKIPDCSCVKQKLRKLFTVL